MCIVADGGKNMQRGISKNIPVWFQKKYNVGSEVEVRYYPAQNGGTVQFEDLAGKTLEFGAIDDDELSNLPHLDKWED